MTTASIPTGAIRPSIVDLAVTRLAVAMLRWSDERARRAQLTHQQQQLHAGVQHDLDATQSWADRARYLG